MARDVRLRTTLRCWLRVCSPLHVGGADDLPGTDATVSRDAAERTVARGSSLTGAITAELGVDPATERNPTWGYSAPRRGEPAPPDGEPAVDAGFASRVWVEDALIGAPPADLNTPPDPVADDWWRSPRLERRDGVGIDRATGAAAPGILYGRQVVAPGAVLALRLSVDSLADTWNADRELLAELLGRLRDGLRLGARTSRGLGLLRLVGQPVVEQVDFTSAETFLDTILAPRAITLPSPVPPRRRTATIEVAWRPRRTVFVAAGVAGEIADILPLTATDPDDSDLLRLVLPGTGVAGALRARAELIARTACGDDTPAEFAAQLSQYDLVTALFGAARGRAGDDGERGTRAAVTVADCHSRTTLPRRVWQELVTDPVAGDGELARERARIERALRLADDEHRLQVVDHVALDRWTGGAAPGRLFSVAEPVGWGWEPLRLTVELDRIPKELHDAAVVLLLLVLRDLREGWVTLGAGATRGRGELEVTEIRAYGLVDVPDTPLDDAWWQEEFPTLPIVEAWWQWLGALNEPDREKGAR